MADLHTEGTACFGTKEKYATFLKPSIKAKSRSSLILSKSSVQKSNKEATLYHSLHSLFLVSFQMIFGTVV